MKILYVDEAGCLGALPEPTSNIQPVFVIAGIAFEASSVGDLTREFLAIKRRFFPGYFKSPHSLDDILTEIKGADIRRTLATGNRNSRRAADMFIGKLFDLIDKYDGWVFGRLWIKRPGGPFEGRAIYTSSMQDICNTYQKYLTQSSARGGWIVADSRNKNKNSNVSHSIFTQKYRSTGDIYPLLSEMPVFGHSNNHAGLQIADLLCSAVLFPSGIECYCKPYITSIHIRDYSLLKSRFMKRLKSRQFRYKDTSGKWRGGITVADAIEKRSGAVLFQ